MKRAALVLLLAILPHIAAAAQPPAPRRAAPGRTPAAPVETEATTPVREDANARQTRESLAQLLRQYPPSLWEVLRLDPSLLTNRSYLEPYPGLASFLAQHPEVAHNPGFFIGDMRVYREENTSYQKMRVIEESLAGVAVFLGFVATLVAVTWIGRAVIDYRRWLRVSKIQTEAHTKLLDRFTANEDLLAYIQTPVGRRFLESAPLALDAGPRPVSAPIGRIMWSVQAGLVVALSGLGLWIVATRLSANGGDAADVAPAVFAIAMLAVAIGAGFILSAIVSYFLSQRLGLLEPPTVTPNG